MPDKPKQSALEEKDLQEKLESLPFDLNAVWEKLSPTERKRAIILQKVHKRFGKEGIAFARPRLTDKRLERPDWDEESFFIHLDRALNGPPHVQLTPTAARRRARKEEEESNSQD